MPQYISAPSPYGSVSAEARRRYEERYAKKRAEEAAKARAEAEAANQPEQPQQPVQQQQSPAPPISLQPGYSQHHPDGYLQQHPGHPQQPQQAAGGLPHPHQNYVRSPPQVVPNDPSVQPQQYHPVQSSAPRQQIQTQQPQRWINPAPQGQGLALGHLSQSHHQQQPEQLSQRQQQWQQAQKHSASPSAPVEDQELQTMFLQFDSSRTGQLNAYDLQRLLAKDARMEAREDAVKMVNIFDTDRSGSINFQEFEGLYRYIQDWHDIFRRFDRDNSGLIDRLELSNALQGFGFTLPPELVAKLVKRFTPPPTLGQTAVSRPGISFDRFLLACVTVKHYTEAFRRLDQGNTGYITVAYNDYMDIVLDAPS
ncbi:calcium-binding protein [Cryptococcus bacillisporus CA1873]|uniref:Unplaced genomic scaffold supercont1.1, whole genome shotgun sequence n=2 Tax=Cryptococcus gattii TaxID=552467 RepID=A0A0D0TU65_CRYGA|nr:calcium-binding protein [Cryptococcus bacillisporus CA1280]KIR67050.1 calcium-binding protein [Cryptococcus bacillisporus CA1873]|eukprot:KIR67050.1 calcium-binding protein [Cryptococcus gattii CA1873]